MAFLTKHGKQDIIAPAFKRLYGIDIVHTDAFDTDTLGTFDNRIARTKSAKETALIKARMACELTGLSAGIGSEGSFNEELGFGIVNQEILAFVDKSNAVEIIASVAKPLPLSVWTVDSMDALKQHHKLFDGAQAWHVFEGQQSGAGLIGKGLQSIDAALLALKGHSFPISLAPDFRAMNCPARQTNIALAAEDLGKRLCALCPKCAHPNFVFDKKESGLPCELCHAPSTLALGSRAKCDHCDHTVMQRNEQAVAPSFYCLSCNP
ncbi:DUF6671 family protein [Glaciecola siphonariae]|uniref:DUF6671 family protein n=1 Tax=Glaciecola siphonariae TaxID=521012 RepID=A0ABV9LXS4_9ALTE